MGAAQLGGKKEDKIGDTMAVTNYAGVIIYDYCYDSFGNQAAFDETDHNPFRYCGEYWDAETGNIYLRARYYDPSMGRFISEDPHWNVETRKKKIKNTEPFWFSVFFVCINMKYFLIFKKSMFLSFLRFMGELF